MRIESAATGVMARRERTISDLLHFDLNTIKSVNIDFDADSPLSSISAVCIYNTDPVKTYHFRTFSPDESTITDKDAWLELMRQEAQLLADEIALGNIHDLQHYALSIDVARRWEHWAFNMQTLFKNIDPVAADQFSRRIYFYNCTDLYAMTTLGLIGWEVQISKETPATIIKSWGKMLAYAQNKSAALAGIYYKNKDSINTKKHMQVEGSELLLKHKLHYLIPEYKPGRAKSAAAPVAATPSWSDYTSTMISSAYNYVIGLAGYVAIDSQPLAPKPESTAERAIKLQDLSDELRSKNVIAASESELLDLANENLIFYEKAFLLLSVIKKVGSNADGAMTELQLVLFNAEAKKYYSEYLNPTMFRMISLLEQILSQKKVMTSRFKLLNTLNNIRQIHGNIQKQKLSFELLGGFNQDDIITPRLDNIEKKMNALGLKVSYENSSLAFFLIETGSIDEYEKSLLSDNQKLIELKRSLDKAIMKCDSYDKLLSLLQGLDVKSSLFLDRLEEYYAQNPDESEMLAMARSRLLLLGITVSRVALELPEVTNNLKASKLPIVYDSNKYITCEVLLPDMKNLNIDTLYGLISGASASDAYIDVNIQVSSLLYVPPQTSNKANNDLRLMQLEAQLDIWMQALDKLLHSQFDTPSSKDYSSVQVCEIYVSASFILNELLNKIRQHYLDSGSNPNILLAKYAKKYESKFEESFIWLEHAILNGAISSRGLFKTLYSRLIGSINIPYVNLLPITCVTLKKHLYETYPSEFELKYSHIKSIVDDALQDHMSVRDRELQRLTLSITDKNTISKVNFDFNSIAGVSSKYRDTHNFEGRLGSFKFRIMETSQEFTKKDLEVLTEEARLIVIGNCLMQAYRYNLIVGDPIKKHNIGLQFYRTALAFTELKNNMSPPLLGVRLQEVNLLIAQKLSLAFEAMVDACLTDLSELKADTLNDLNEVGVTLCRLIQDASIGQEYLMSGVVLEAQLNNDKISMFKETYKSMAMNETAKFPKHGFKFS